MSNREIRIATWNVRGLTDSEKKENLGKDCSRYRLDVTAIQETKIFNSDEIESKNKFKLVLFEQKKLNIEYWVLLLVLELKVG